MSTPALRLAVSGAMPRQRCILEGAPERWSVAVDRAYDLRIELAHGEPPGWLRVRFRRRPEDGPDVAVQAGALSGCWGERDLLEQAYEFMIGPGVELEISPASEGDRG